MFVTGAVLWRDWHSLAPEGVDQEARIDGCEWRSMHRQKVLIGSRVGSGYYSCHYSYRVEGSGPAQARGPLRRIWSAARRPRGR
jgi:hypothetical protein